jgi:hypothetical protein
MGPLDRMRLGKVESGNISSVRIDSDRWRRLRSGLSDLGTSIRPWLPPVNYITIHYAYFVLLGLAATLIFWGASRPALSIGFWDSMFLAFSALTSAGLNTVNISGQSSPKRMSRPVSSPDLL